MKIEANQIGMRVVGIAVLMSKQSQSLIAIGNGHHTLVETGHVKCFFGQGGAGRIVFDNPDVQLVVVRGIVLRTEGHSDLLDGSTRRALLSMSSG